MVARANQKKKKKAHLRVIKYSKWVEMTRNTLYSLFRASFQMCFEGLHALPIRHYEYMGLT